MGKMNKNVLIITLLMFVSFFSIVNVHGNSNLTPKVDGLHSSYVDVHNIIINGNWSKTMDMYDWCKGVGTEKDPYVIDGISINVDGYGGALQILNSVEYFIIRNCNFSFASDYNLGKDLKSLYSNLFAGIYVENAKNGIIENCIFYHNFHGISINSVENIEIRDNEFYGTHDDIHTGFGKAIRITKGVNIIITGNYIVNHYDGICIWNSEKNYVDYNHIENNLFDAISETGVYFVSVKDGSISHNDFYGVKSETTESSGISALAFGISLIKLENCINIEVNGNNFYGLGRVNDGESFQFFWILFTILIVSGIVLFILTLYHRRKNS